ncbi:MAG: cobalamin biosynthesis protein CobD [Bacteroidaceae bacterium]|nr:cobalamin biosynthesis protein CobD [Bacteroidaceae bacterium]
MPIDFSFIGSPLWGSGERGLIFTLLLGWLLDLLLGDPAWLPHPVVGFGKAISFFEHRLNHGSHRKLKGALMSIALIIATYAIGLIFNFQLSIFNFLIVFFCLAGTTLIREVRQVFLALDRSLEEGRKQVARIVGRDTKELSAQEVRTAALETLAENLSDGVIAPLFWFAILGVPGMLAYKMVNTLDSMIGYKTERYKDFGCWAARIDDIANYIPARLTALQMILPYVIINCQLSIFNFVRKYGPRHASPNSGYPEAALAGILNCRFGGPHYYFGELFDKPYIGENDRPLTSADMKTAIRVNRTAEVLMLLLVVAVQIAVSM